MIIEDAINIMRAVKGVLITYELFENQNDANNSATTFKIFDFL
jgi:hypothetical protein